MGKKNGGNPRGTGQACHTVRLSLPGLVQQKSTTVAGFLKEGHKSPSPNLHKMGYNHLSTGKRQQVQTDALGPSGMNT